MGTTVFMTASIFVTSGSLVLGCPGTGTRAPLTRVRAPLKLWWVQPCSASQAAAEVTSALGVQLNLGSLVRDPGASRDLWVSRAG